jgi:hypothetical protein
MSSQEGKAVLQPKGDRGPPDVSNLVPYALGLQGGRLADMFGAAFIGSSGHVACERQATLQPA